jgi:hypothetical protein
MNFIFAKLFEEYKRKNDSPKFNITLYISTFYSFLLFAIFLPLSETLQKILLDEKIKYSKTALYITIFSVFGLIIYIVFKRYVQSGYLESLSQKYKKKKIGKFFLYTSIVIFPIFFLLFGVTLTILLIGGNMLGYVIAGIF